MRRRYVRPRGAARFKPISRAPTGWSASTLREKLDSLRDSEVQPGDCRRHCHLWPSSAEEQSGMGRLRIVEIPGDLRRSGHEVSEVARHTGVNVKSHPIVKHASPVFAAGPSAENRDSGSSNSHFLHAGQVFVSAEAKPIVLILGSCVGVCIWDEVNAIGGATHFLRPSWDGTGVASPRYGSVAISMLLQRLLEAGASRGQLRAKVFGGGCLFGALRETGSNKEQHLGTRNVEIALEILAKAQIPVVSSQVGVDRGQRVVFRTDTGETVI